MNQLEAWIHTPVAKALGWSLIHFLWEGTSIALQLVVLLVLCRGREARLRYGLSCLALLAMAGAFGVTFALSMPSRPGAPFAPAQVILAPLGPLSLEAGPAARPWLLELKARLPWVVPFWMAGVVALYLRSVAGWLAVRRMRRTGVCVASGEWQGRLERLRERLNVSRPVAMLESCLIDVPMVMGFLRPVILMPMGLLAGLSTGQLEAILIHELAHIRRWDYVVNLFQNLLESLLFYHPAVWWVSGQVRSERENCCDDVVVKLKGDARGYAAALARLEHNRWPVREPALAATGGSLMKRIHRLLQEPEGPRTTAAPVLVVGLLVVALGVAAAGWQGKTGSTPKASPAVEGMPDSAAASVVSAQPKKLPVALVAQVRPAQDPVAAGDRAGEIGKKQQKPRKQAYELGIEGASPYLKWITQDVVYISSEEERRAFRNLQSDAEREHFIEQFWLRRDPTPDTFENEMREEHYRRIAYVNERFGYDGVAGWKTDRGRVYISYGPPDEIESHPSGGAYKRPAAEGGGTTNTFPFEQWLYQHIQGVGNNVIIDFVDPARTGEYRMATDPSAKDAAGPRYYVVGEVNSPGSFPVAASTTVTDALAKAGGFKAFAQREIIIQRGTKQLKFNFNQYLMGENRQQNIVLEPGDQIIVK